MDDGIKNVIKEEYRVRGLKWPTTMQAILWVITELGEACEAILAEFEWVRNHPEDHPAGFSKERLEAELGDVIKMLMVVAILNNLSPITNMVMKANRRITDA